MIFFGISVSKNCSFDFLFIKVMYQKVIKVLSVIREKATANNNYFNKYIRPVCYSHGYLLDEILRISFFLFYLNSSSSNVLSVPDVGH